MIKGADSKIMERLNKADKIIVQEKATELSKLGLRTLVFAAK